MTVKSDAEIERILLDDPHIVRIEQSENWEIPTIDRNLWSEQYRGDRAFDINTLISYLNLRYIVDDFGENHLSRRLWESQLAAKHERMQAYFTNNALGFGKIVTVRSFTQGLKEGYEKEFM